MMKKAIIISFTVIVIIGILLFNLHKDKEYYESSNDRFDYLAEPKEIIFDGQVVNSSDYLELLVKTSDNCFKSNCSNRTGWSEEEIKKERSGNSKQGYIINTAEAGYEWGNLETDPARFAIITIPKKDFNSSWLEKEYNYSNPITELNDTCFEICEKEGGKNCEDDCQFETGNYELLSERKFRFPLDEFLNESELTLLKTLPYNTKVNWTIRKDVTNISSKVEYNDWDTKEPELKLHGSAGQFTVCPTGQGCNYTNLTSWEAGEEAVLTGSGACIVNITGDWTGVRDGQFMISGWTTTADDYIKIQTDTTARHDGILYNKATAYIINMTDDYVIDIREDFVTIDGLQLVMTYPTGTGYDRAIYIGNSVTNPAAEINLTNNLYEVSSNALGHVACIYSNMYASSVINIYNSICLGANYRAIEIAGNNANISNSLCAHATTDCFKESTANLTRCVNCISYNNTDDFDSWDIVQYSASDDGDGDNAVAVGDWDAQFVDRAGYDYHLVSTSVLIDNGTDRTIAGFNTDIDGEERTGTWDVGADEYVTAEEDTDEPIISTAPINISRSNVSIFFNVTLNEPANTSGTYGVAPACSGSGTFSNTTKATTLHFNITGLTNSTKYCYNFTSICDASANCNTTGYPFNFTTASYIIPSGDTCDCTSIQTRNPIDCTENCDIEECDAMGTIVYMNGSGNIILVGTLYNYTGIQVHNGCVFNSNGQLATT